MSLKTMATIAADRAARVLEVSMATRTAKTPAPKAPAVPPEQATVVLVWGGDEYRVAQRAKQLLQVWCPPEQQDLGLEVVDGAVDTIDEAVAAIQRVLDGVTTVSCSAAPRWCGCAGQASFFSEAVPGKFESVKEAVARLTEEIKRGLLPGQRLLITAPKVHRGYGFYKACVAAGAVVEIEVSDKPKELMEQAQGTVRELLKAEHLTASATTIHLLVEKAGYDTRLLLQEVTKLATYLGDRREVTEEDVRLLVSPSRESVAWDLAEVLSQRDLATCLRLFRQLMFQKRKNRLCCSWASRGASATCWPCASSWKPATCGWPNRAAVLPTWCCRNSRRPWRPPRA